MSEMAEIERIFAEARLSEELSSAPEGPFWEWHDKIR
jgi:hypothetical protein